MRTRLLRPTRGGIARAARILRRGGLVAFPTETVYGLGALALDRRAVRRVFRAKGRPSSDPLIVHLASADDLPLVTTRVPDTASLLAKRFWPGPLTLVLPRARRVPREAAGGLATVAVRVPDHPVARALLHAVDAPLVGPSANRFGHLSPTTAQAVLDDLDGRIDAVLDAGPTRHGIESTIVSLAGPRPRILRLGALPRPDIARALGTPIEVARRAVAPGRFGRHYAPRARLELVSPARARAARRRGEAVWMTPASPRLAAKRLYSALRILDPGPRGVLYVSRPPRTSAWEAVNERLLRAAIPR